MIKIEIKDIDWNKFKAGMYNGKLFIEGHGIRYDLMINDIYNKIDSGINIAKKYNTTAGYVSQVKKKFSQLKYPPLIKDGKLKCFLCDNQKGLTFHHNHETGENIAILCRGCNRKVGDNELEYSDKTKKVVEGRLEIENKIFSLLELESQSKKEIIKKLNLIENKHYIGMGITNLLQKNRIVRFKFKIPNTTGSYKYIYTTTKILLRELYDLMDSKMKFEKKAVNEDIELIKQVELVIK